MSSFKIYISTCVGGMDGRYKCFMVVVEPLIHKRDRMLEALTMVLDLNKQMVTRSRMPTWVHGISLTLKYRGPRATFQTRQRMSCQQMNRGLACLQTDMWVLLVWMMYAAGASSCIRFYVMMTSIPNAMPNGYDG